MLGSSGGKSSSSSSSTTNQTQTSTPTNPAWVTGGLGGIGQTVTDLNNLDPYSLVPGANAQQTQAATTAGGLGTTSNTLMNLGASTVAGAGATPITTAATAPAVSQLISHFMNPNIQSVVNPALAAFDYGAGQNTAQQQLTQAGTDSAFGGSGAALAAAATASQNNLQRGQLAGSLYGDAYNSGLQGAENEGNLIMQARQQNLDAQIANAQNQQTTGTNLANIGQTIDATGRANATTQQGVGDDLYNISANQAQAPITTANALASIWSQLPLNLLHGETDTLNGTTSGKGNTTSLSGGFSFG